MKYRIIAAAVIFFILFICLPWQKALVIEDVKHHKPLLYIPVKTGETFVICYTHSVNKTGVYDTLRIEGTQLVVVKSQYQSFGAGMTEYEMEPGMSMSLDENGRIVLTNINRIIPELKLFVGVTADHHLIIQNQDISLASIMEPGQPLLFKINQVSPIQLWKGRCKDG